MTALEIFEEINARKMQGIVFHAQLADYFDFLNLHGFKRMHEYHYLLESVELRGMHRYVINHLNKLMHEYTVIDAKTIPTNWYGYARMDIDPSTRKTAVKDAFMKWYEWESDTRALLEKKFKELTDMGCIAYANKVNQLINDVDQELKHVTRDLIKYKAVDWDMCMISMEQDEMHECYRQKEKEIGVDIC